jgi:hypothetical protein
MTPLPASSWRKTTINGEKRIAFDLASYGVAASVME